MLAKRRHQKILGLLESLGEVKIQELADHFGVSSMTIRRDLNGLEVQGLLQRTHGGAVLVKENDVEPPLANKQAVHQLEKHYIAEMALKWISPGMNIILDAGSTTMALAQKLAEKAPLTVVTTDLEIGRYLSDVSDIAVFVTGGQVKGGVYRLEGEYTLHLLREVTADIAFLGCDGFTPQYVFSNTVAQAYLKQAILSASTKKILLADASKFERVAFSKVISTQDFDAVLVDYQLSESARTSLRQMGIALYVGEEALP